MLAAGERIQIGQVGKLRGREPTYDRRSERDVCDWLAYSGLANGRTLLPVSVSETSVGSWLASAGVIELTGLPASRRCLNRTKRGRLASAAIALFERSSDSI